MGVFLFNVTIDDLEDRDDPARLGLPSPGSQDEDLLEEPEWDAPADGGFGAADDLGVQAFGQSPSLTDEDAEEVPWNAPAAGGYGSVDPRPPPGQR